MDLEHHRCNNSSVRWRVSVHPESPTYRNRQNVLQIIFSLMRRPEPIYIRSIGIKHNISRKGSTLYQLYWNLADMSHTGANYDLYRQKIQEFGHSSYPVEFPKVKVFMNAHAKQPTPEYRWFDSFDIYCWFGICFTLILIFVFGITKNRTARITYIFLTALCSTVIGTAFSAHLVNFQVETSEFDLNSVDRIIDALETNRFHLVHHQIKEDTVYKLGHLDNQQQSRLIQALHHNPIIHAKKTKRPKVVASNATYFSLLTNKVVAPVCSKTTPICQNLDSRLLYQNYHIVLLNKRFFNRKSCIADLNKALMKFSQAGLVEKQERYYEVKSAAAIRPRQLTRNKFEFSDIRLILNIYAVAICVSIMQLCSEYVYCRCIMRAVTSVLRAVFRFGEK